MHGRVEAVRIGQEGWRGDYQRVAPALGIVALVPPGLGWASSPSALCGVLHEHGFSTLCVDLDLPAGAPDPEATRRLVEALDWLRDVGAGMPVGLFGHGPGATAALQAAATKPSRVSALVTRGASPAALGPRLAQLQAATLFIVGDDDAAMLQAHRQGMRLLGGAKRLEVVPGAGLRGTDTAALDSVAHLAADWFARHLPAARLH